DKVPTRTGYTVTDVRLLREVERRDGLREPLPDVPGQRVPRELAVDDLERLLELRAELVLPLNSERSGAHDEDAVEDAAELQLLDEQTGHDRLAGTRIVREE